MKKIIFFIIVFFLQIIPNTYAETGEKTSMCLMNAVTGEIVYEKDAFSERPMASTTKIMTALLAIENSRMDDVVTMSYDAVYAGGSSTYAKVGDCLYMEDALYGLMLNSGNDAAEAIAASFDGGRSAFIQSMNDRAKSIGAEHTCFLNPSGLPEEGHYSTAYDLALIAKEALSNKKFAEIVSTHSKTAFLVNAPDKQLVFHNHNKLLNLYGDCTGVKTGYTKKAGRCLVSSAERDGMKYLAVTLNDANDWKNHCELYERVFAESMPLKVVGCGDVVRTADGHSFSAAEDFIIPSLKLEKTEAEVNIYVPSLINGPLNKNEKVGYIQILYNGQEVGRVDVVSNEDIVGKGMVVTRKSFLTFFIRQLNKLMV